MKTETARKTEKNIQEFKQLLSSFLDVKLRYKLHYSRKNDQEFVYGIYQADRKTWFWKTEDAYLAEISTLDFTLPFEKEEWEDLKFVIIDKSTSEAFLKIAEEYQFRTGKKVLIEKLF